MNAQMKKKKMMKTKNVKLLKLGENGGKTKITNHMIMMQNDEITTDEKLQKF